MEPITTKPSPTAKRTPKSFWQRLRLRPFFIRWSNWEYYPMWLVSIPTIFYWLFLNLRARAWCWFSAANPAIYTGGMFGESKEDIHQITPPEHMPKNIYVTPELSEEAIVAQVQALGLTYPVIGKPDIGGRGSGVRKLKDEAELRAYIQRHRSITFHIQEFLDDPIEAGVMFYRMPDSDECGILSVTLKKFLSITGDGVSTFEELVGDNPRAILVLDRIQQRYGHRFAEVLPAGETIELEPVGNHCRGTMFVSGMHLVDADMIEGFRAITSKIDGLYFCRYDLRCPSLDDLRKGKNIKIIEINGVGADPTHVYDPSISIWKKYGIIFRQWSIMFRIARANHRRGIPYMSLAEALRHRKAVNATKEVIED